MNCTISSQSYRPDRRFLKRGPLTTFLILLFGFNAAMFAEDSRQAKSSPGPIRATHLLGFEGVPNNANGTLTASGDALQFQKKGKPVVEVKVAAVQSVFLGDESRQVGGLPMTLGKAAVPFGGGRAVSLFAHKKYDTVALEYVDRNGGFHGAIFQLDKGQGEILRNELVALGAHLNNNEGQSAKQGAAEASSENQ